MSPFKVLYVSLINECDTFYFKAHFRFISNNYMLCLIILLILPVRCFALLNCEYFMRVDSVCLFVCLFVYSCVDPKFVFVCLFVVVVFVVVVVFNGIKECLTCSGIPVRKICLHS